MSTINVSINIIIILHINLKLISHIYIIYLITSCSSISRRHSLLIPGLSPRQNSKGNGTNGERHRNDDQRQKDQNHAGST